MGTPGKLPLHIPLPGDWADKAACLNHPNPDLWWPDPFDPAREAKAICAACPVREACSEYAVETHTRFGVWGGKTAHERNPRRNRGPGRKKAS